ncbi:MAG TPA: peptidoglycan DD-metalloendopeptidase family protein [Actinomycetota bacterium]|nr:peptidoglycan DD-metalloendopeptidase family protein [Actinomycetota bacterium]
MTRRARLTGRAGAVVVAAMLALAPVAPAGVVAAPSTQEYDQVVRRLEKARALIRETEQREKGLKTGIAARQARRRAAEIEIEELTAVVESAQGKVQEAEGALSQVEVRLQARTEELERTVRELREARETLNERAVQTFKAGPASMLDTLLSARSVAELSSRMQFVSRVFRRDKTHIDTVSEAKAKIDDERTRITVLRDRLSEQAEVVQTERDEAATVRNRADSRRKVLTAELQSLGTNLKVVQKDKERYQLEQQQLESDSRDIAAFLRSRGSKKTKVPAATAAPKVPDVEKPGTTKEPGATDKPGTKEPPVADKAPPAASQPPSATSLGWPVTGPITSGFGYRTHPIYGTKRMHTGIDIGAPTGRAIAAAGAGTVIFAGVKGGYGNAVIVDHGDGLATLYAHMSSITSSVGARVGRGATIGKVGCTGACTGPHLHFEVRVNGEPQNPTRWL